MNNHHISNRLTCYPEKLAAEIANIAANAAAGDAIRMQDGTLIGYVVDDLGQFFDNHQTGNKSYWQEFMSLPRELVAVHGKTRACDLPNRSRCYAKRTAITRKGIVINQILERCFNEPHWINISDTTIVYTADEYKMLNSRGHFTLKAG
jgi:hypothetical protein